MLKKILPVLIVILVVVVAVYIWWEYSPSRNVYEVDEVITGDPSDCNDDLLLAVIGDFGNASQREKDVAAMVRSWGVDYVLTVGDNNYPDGKARTIDKNIGQYYHDYIYPYQGGYGEGASENRFFPALGNHDWHTGDIDAYLDYLTLPGNERYYDVELGPVHLFVVDSNEEEPDGRAADSDQAEWLQIQMTTSTAPWKLVNLHHVPYSSGAKHGDDPETQWPYAEWGATAVLSGHQHSYERIRRNDILYFINGLGGRWWIHTFAEPVSGSAVRYNQDFGAMLITADDSCINFAFYNRSEELIDSVTITQP
jgi:tartrate-resistant acid phosphatase type 5